MFRFFPKKAHICCISVIDTNLCKMLVDFYLWSLLRLNNLNIIFYFCFWSLFLKFFFVKLKRFFFSVSVRVWKMLFLLHFITTFTFKLNFSYKLIFGHNYGKGNNKKLYREVLQFWKDFLNNIINWRKDFILNFIIYLAKIFLFQNMFMFKNNIISLFSNMLQTKICCLLTKWKKCS